MSEVADALELTFQPILQADLGVTYSVTTRNAPAERPDLVAPIVGAVTIAAVETGDNQAVNLGGRLARDGELRFHCAVPASAAASVLTNLVAAVKDSIEGAAIASGWEMLILDTRDGDEEELDEGKAREHTLVYTFTALNAVV